MKLHTKSQAPKEGKAPEPKQQKPVRLCDEWTGLSGGPFKVGVIWVLTPSAA